MRIAELKDKKILIVGFGREGQDSFLFLRKTFPRKMLGVADRLAYEHLPKETRELLRKDKKVAGYWGDQYLKSLQKYDVILKSPGIPLHTLNPLLLPKHILTSQTNIFFENFPGMIIGVTGTKGKSTTASLIHEVLKSGGVNASLAGNIGRPVLGLLQKAAANSVVVYELSSFQLETITQSPHIAVFLNLYPEHLDHHGTFKNYMRAKAKIGAFQSKDDYFIFNGSDPRVQKIAERLRAKKFPFSPRKSGKTPFVASTEPAILVGSLFRIPKAKIKAAIKRFKPLPHRLEFAGEHRGIRFYNDSLATIPEAAISALDALGKDVHTIILGGYDRGIAFDGLAKRILASNIKTLILFPATGELIWKETLQMITSRRSRKKPQHFFVNTMATAVELCYRNTPKGKICLLSPASSSFTLFADYKDRGEQFKKFVKIYAGYGKKKLS